MASAAPPLPPAGAPSIGPDHASKDADSAGLNGGVKAANSTSLKASEQVLYSDIGINVLLGRLKQSIASVRDFSAFLKRRSALEEEHAGGLRKISRMNYETAQKPESRSGSYADQLKEITRSHDKMADNGSRFAEALLHIHEELNELSNNMERSRKQWKQDGLNNEKRVKDAEGLMEKAKAKYDSSADSYDRVRTGDSTGRSFGIKGPKSAEQREEDLKNKMQVADADYAAKVQAAQTARQENLARLRPKALKALQDLINECDSALSLQLQRFAAFNEKLLVSNGVVISPVKASNDAHAGPLSMRDCISKIDNDNDFHAYVSSHSNSVPPRPAEIKYEKHPSQTSGGSALNQSVVHPAGAAGQSSAGPSTAAVTPSRPNAPALSLAPQQSSFSQAPAAPQLTPDRAFKGPPGHAPPSITTAATIQSPRDASPQSAQSSASPYGAQKAQQQPMPAYPGSRSGSGQMPPSASQRNGEHAALPPYNRVFGLSLEELYRRDDSAVPIVVYQCIQAVDLFGLEVEGIYRISGNSNHIAALKAQFDHDPSKMDFRNPENFHHDVNDAAGLLKQFLRDLPDPLFTQEHYAEFIQAARVDDDIQRRDSLHAIINSLPDPNYATLRAVILHLWRIQEHANVNRMTTHNIALCLAPTLLGSTTGSQMIDAGLQARVVDTILQNTLSIFDED